MKASDFRLGQRVRRRTDESSFVRDRNNHPALRGRRIGIVIGLPERLSERHMAARVQWEGSTRTDHVLIHRLESLPLKQQPVALGGEWSPSQGGVLAKTAS